MADWIVEGDPGLDVWHMDLRRFGAQYRSRRLTLERTHEIYRTLLRPPLPEPGARGRAAAPPVAGVSAAPRARRLVRREVGLGAPELVRAERGRRETRAGGRAGSPGRFWSPAIEAEHVATRERAGLFDETSFSKLEVVGPGALGLLQRLCGNDVDKPVGSVVYTSMLNERGGIECDFTVTRLGPTRFRIVTGTAFGTHDRGFIQRHLPADGSVALLDVTGGSCCFGLWGPRARDILAATTTRGRVERGPSRTSTAREIPVGRVPDARGAGHLRGRARLGALRAHGVRARAVGHAVGGGPAARPGGCRVPRHRLPPPREGVPVLERRHHPRRHAAMRRGSASRSSWGRPSFCGRDVLARQRAAGVRRKLACLTLSDPGWVALGGEPVRAAGRVVGRVTSGGFGYSRRPVHRVCVPPGRARGARDVGGRRVLRRMGRGAGGRRAPLGPARRPDPELIPYDRRAWLASLGSEECDSCPSRPGDAARGHGDPMPRIAANGIRLHYEEAGQGVPARLRSRVRRGRPELAAPGALLRPPLPDDRLQRPGLPALGRPDRRAPPTPRTTRSRTSGACSTPSGSTGRTSAGCRWAATPRSTSGCATRSGRCPWSSPAAGTGAWPTDRAQFHRDVSATAERFLTEPMATLADVYCQGPTRVQFRDKDPRGWQEFHDQFAAQSALGHGLTMRGVQLTRPCVYELEAELERLTVPTLIVTGDEDEPVPRAGALPEAEDPHLGPGGAPAGWAHDQPRGAGGLQPGGPGLPHRGRSRALGPA